MMNISILIITKNEEQDLPGCISSVSWSDDIHVLDSESTDATVVIASEMGAKVAVRKFDGYSSQRNAGLGLPFSNDWVLILDADERVPRELVDEMRFFVSNSGNYYSAARIRRRDFWWGRWLKHAQISPFYVRLVRLGQVHYEREINEVLVVDGEIADLSGYFDHFPFSKGLDHWVEKHNRYSRMEAALIVAGPAVKPSLTVAIFGKDCNQRRIHQKAIFYRLPGRPLIKLFYMMFVRGAFLDGWAGIRYAILQSVYEYLIVLKTKELKAVKQGAVV